MIFTIPKNKHRALPLRFWAWWQRRLFTWQVTFSESCRYDLQSADQLDTNKLIGVGYLPWHHVDSARFGWAYNLQTGKIDLSAYCYVNSNRIIKPICSCDIGKPYRIELYCLLGTYYFTACEAKTFTPIVGVEVTHGHYKKFQYRLTTFFGGNRTAPQEIQIEIV